jgi:regulatory protein
MSDTDNPAQDKRRRRELTPAQRALALLVRREHSRKELVLKLRARGIEADEATAAVDRMTQSGWQDDVRFAGSVARTRAAAGYGPLYIRAELGSHGIGEGVISEALASLEMAGDTDWAATAREQVRRRFGDIDKLTLPVQRKAADYLARRGFHGDSIRSAIRSRRD